MKNLRNQIAAVVVAWWLIVATSTLAQGSGAYVASNRQAVQVRLRLKSESHDGIVLESSIRNVGKTAVYVVADPERSDQSLGPYVDAENLDVGLLKCGVLLYPPNPFSPFINWTGAHLILLAPGESRKATFKLEPPLRSTMPPFYKEPKTVDIPMNIIKRVQLDVGVIPISDSLAALVTRKRAPNDSFGGSEPVEVGTTTIPLYKIQQVAHSNEVVVGVK